MDRSTVKTATELSERSPEEIRSAHAENKVESRATEQVLRLHAYAVEHGLSLKDLSKATKIPDGTLSAIFSGKYPGNFIAQANRIDQFFYEERNREIFGGCREFVKTKMALSLWRVFEQTRYSRRIQVLQSEEQLGKSRAAREYAVEHNSGRTFLLKLVPGGTSNPFGVFLRDLAKTLGLSTDKQKIIELRFKIREKLAPCDLGILDEFHLIADWPDCAIRDFLNYLRVELHDDGKRGIVLVATNTDVMTLLDVFRKRLHYNIGQLLGRMINRPLELYADEIPLDDVRALVERYYSPSKETLKKLYDLCTRPKLGHFGLLDDVLSRAWASAQLGGEKLTDTAVITIARQTLEELDKHKELYK